MIHSTMGVESAESGSGSGSGSQVWEVGRAQNRNEKRKREEC